MDLNKLAAMANKLSIPQLQQAIQSGTLPAYIGVPMLQKRVQDSKQAQMAQQAQQAPQAQAPIADQVMQEAQGIAGVESNLPQEYADGGIVAFAGGGRMPKTMAEQLEELLAKQKMEEYYKQLGWTPEAIESYEPSVYQTPEEARASMSRRGLAATQQPMSLDELTQAQARLRAQTGLGVRAENVMEMPPYQERVEMPKTQLPQTTSVAGEYVPYTPMEQSGIAALNKPSATIEGASFEMPRTTPRADTEAAKAYYAEEAAKKGYRPMSKEAADYARSKTAQQAAFDNAHMDQLYRNAQAAEQQAAQQAASPSAKAFKGLQGAKLSGQAIDSGTVSEALRGLLDQPNAKNPELLSRVKRGFGAQEEIGLSPWLHDVYSGYEEEGVPGAVQSIGKNIGKFAKEAGAFAGDIGSAASNVGSGVADLASRAYYGPKGKPRSEVGSRQAGKDEILKYINEAAAANGIDPNLLYGVAMTESSLNPNAKSNKGAMGMMQIMPGTAKELGLTNPYDPRESAFAGAKYLRDLKDRFGDDDLALSGYNMGPNRSIETLKGNTKYTSKVRENMANSPFASATTATQQPAPAAAQLAPPEAMQTPFAIPAFDESPYKAAMSSEDEMDARKRMEYMQSLMGEDEGRSAREARMSKKEQEIAKDRDQAKWMALLQASLATMAGTSPFAMANIGAGGIAGLKSYAEDTKDINRAQDKLDELRSSYEDARRAEQRAAAKHGVDSAQVAKAHNKAMALQMAKDKAEQEYKWATLGETRAHNEALAKYYGRPTAAASGGAFDTVFYRNLLSQVMENPKAYPEYTTNGQVDHRKIANHVKQLTNPQATGLEAIMADFGAKNGMGGSGTSIKEPEQTGANTYRYGYN